MALPSLSASASSGASSGDSAQRNGGVSFGQVNFKAKATDTRSMPSALDIAPSSGTSPVVWIVGAVAVAGLAFVVVRSLRRRI